MLGFVPSEATEHAIDAYGHAIQPIPQTSVFNERNALQFPFTARTWSYVPVLQRATSCCLPIVSSGAVLPTMHRKPAKFRLPCLGVFKQPAWTREQHRKFGPYIDNGLTWIGGQDARNGTQNDVNTDKIARRRFSVYDKVTIVTLKIALSHLEPREMFI